MEPDLRSMATVLEKKRPSARKVVPNNWAVGIWVIVIIVQLLSKYMIIGYLDPWGKPFKPCTLPAPPTFPNKITEARSSVFTM